MNVKDKMSDPESDEKDEAGVRKIKSAVDLQRLKLEKLMSKPEKPVHIPEKSKEKLPRGPLEFIRNIWGSSSGAGSGDFHVYRGVRRREYARQKFNKEKNDREDADAAYKEKMKQNVIEAEERTAKKRAKRLKKKEKMKNRKKMKKAEGDKPAASSDDSDASDRDDAGTQDGDADRQHTDENTQETDSVKKDTDSVKQHS